MQQEFFYKNQLPPNLNIYHLQLSTSLSSSYSGYRSKQIFSITLTLNAIMKFSTLSVGILAGLVTATPTPTRDEVANNVNAKRASVSDVCQFISHPNSFYSHNLHTHSRLLLVFITNFLQVLYVTHCSIRICLSKWRNYWRSWWNYYHRFYLCPVYRGCFRKCQESCLPQWFNYHDCRPSQDW